MSSCGASCSICCHLASYVSATSASSPTANALRSCRYASNCSAAQRRWLLRLHPRLPIRLVHSGTVQSAVQPCTSSSGCQLRSFCFAPHLNQTGTQHEAPSPSSAFACASAHTPIPCLFRPKHLGCQPLHQASASQYAAPSGPSVSGTSPTQSVPDPSAPVQTDSKYIGFHEGGFLQVAVSEAPPLRPRRRTLLPDGALQIQH